MKNENIADNEWFWLICSLSMVVIAVFTMGMGCGPSDPDPCEQDRFDCDDNTTDFSYDDSCTLTGDLQVEIGQGQSSFKALDPNQQPTIHYGGQGGSHIFGAVRVLNAATDQYDKLSVQVTLEQVVSCESQPNLEGSDASDASAADMPTSDMPPTDMTSDVIQPDGICYDEFPMAERALIFGSGREIRMVDGVVAEHGILMQLRGGNAGTSTRLHVTVEDPCRRTGEAEHVFDWTP